MAQGLFFSLTELINFELHKLSIGHLPWLPQVCGKMLTFTTGGNVVENIIIHKIISPFFYKIILFYLFYFIFILFVCYFYFICLL